jgi:hypothetical protein
VGANLRFRILHPLVAPVDRITPAFVRAAVVRDTTPPSGIVPATATPLSGSPDRALRDLAMFASASALHMTGAMNEARAGFVALAVVGSLASAEPAPGDRADGCDDYGECADGGGLPPCPEGEVCSDATPYGLSFGGPDFGEDIFSDQGPPKVTAVGGTQTIDIYGLGGLPYDATGSDHFDVVANADGSVTVTGTAAGSGYLRIVEPGTGLLYDRILLRVDEVATASVIDGAFFFPTTEADEPRVYFAGGVHPLVIALHADDGGRLVDDNLAFTLPAGWSTDPGRWDRFTSGPGVGAGTFPVPVSLSGGATATAALPLVDDVDQLDAVPNFGPEQGVRVGSTRTLCFRATDNGVVVRGVPLVAYPDQRIDIVPVGDDPILYSGCLGVAGIQVGTSQLVVQADSVAATFEVPVLPPAAVAPDSATLPPRPPRAAPAAGERSALAIAP